jgi:polysaccharide pyruvyl transferase WcaK-like protein
MRVALWNGSGLENVGDRLIDAVTRRELQLRLPEAEFRSFSPWPGPFTRQRLTINSEGYWNAHGQFDVIVVGGGALITGPPFGDPAAQFFLFGPYPKRFRDAAMVIWNAMCSDGQSLAPSEERWRNFICDAARQVTLLTVRNTRTSAFLRECGVTAPISVVPDVAVLAAEPSALANNSGKLRIGIAPGRPVFPDDFLAAIKANVEVIEDHVNESIMRRFRYCPPGPFDDHQYAENLAAALNEIASAEFSVFGSDCMYGDAIPARLLAHKISGARYVHWKDALASDMIASMRELDCILTFRLHASITALATGTPFVAVDLYNDATGGTSKLREFMQEAGLPSRYTTLDALMSDRKLLSHLVANAIYQGREPVHNAHNQLAARARNHFDIMAERIAAHALAFC